MTGSQSGQRKVGLAPAGGSGSGIVVAFASEGIVEATAPEAMEAVRSELTLGADKADSTTEHCLGPAVHSSPKPAAVAIAKVGIRSAATASGHNTGLRSIAPRASTGTVTECSRFAAGTFISSRLSAAGAVRPSALLRPARNQHG